MSPPGQGRGDPLPRSPQSYSFDVGITTHSALQEGITALQYARVDVVATSYTEASQIAIQMGFCSGYVTSCHYVE